MMEERPGEHTNKGTKAVEAAGSSVETEGSAATPPPRAVKAARPTRLLIFAALLVAALSAAIFLFRNPGSLNRIRESAEEVGTLLTGTPTPTPDPYAEAVLKAEEERGEPTGRQAKIEIPSELKQYSNARRFLAIQKASAEEAGIRSPHDFAELAGMIAGGREFVEMPRLGRGYVLYGVGLSAVGTVTHYEGRQGKSVPLFADEAELEAREEELGAERKRLENELKELDSSLKATGKNEREARKRLLADIAARNKALKATKETQSLLADAYGTAKEKQKLFDEYGVLSTLARNFGGRSYDLREPASAREFQAHMLSHIRPQALVVIEELGSSYQAKFERPLPITSLVRTEEYQRLLRESGNPNAAKTEPPPHTTGLAFDVFYRFMTAAEQEFVMSEVARLERDGRVEALRELRDHYHIFVFPEGRPPKEKSVEKVLKGGKVRED